MILVTSELQAVVTNDRRSSKKINDLVRKSTQGTTHGIRAIPGHSPEKGRSKMIFIFPVF
jgi:hypothetical protein